MLLTAGLGILTVGTAMSSIKDVVEGSLTKDDRKNLESKNNVEKEGILKRLEELNTKNEKVLKDYVYKWRGIDTKFNKIENPDYNRAYFEPIYEGTPLSKVVFKKFDKEKFEIDNGIVNTSDRTKERLVYYKTLNNDENTFSKAETVAMATTAAAGTALANNALNGAATCLKASTGTPIKMLSGASKMNATNAAFGGGAIAAGGMGKVAGGAIKGGASVAAGAKLRTSAYKKYNKMVLELENERCLNLKKAKDELRELENTIIDIHMVAENSIQRLKKLKEKMDLLSKEDALKELDGLKEELKAIEKTNVLLALNYVKNKYSYIKELSK